MTVKRVFLLALLISFAAVPLQADTGACSAAHIGDAATLFDIHGRYYKEIIKSRGMTAKAILDGPALTAKVTTAFADIRRDHQREYGLLVYLFDKFRDETGQDQDYLCAVLLDAGGEVARAGTAISNDQAGALIRRLSKSLKVQLRSAARAPQPLNRGIQPADSDDDVIDLEWSEMSAEEQAEDRAITSETPDDILKKLSIILFPDTIQRHIPRYDGLAIMPDRSLGTLPWAMMRPLPDGQPMIDHVEHWIIPDVRALDYKLGVFTLTPDWNPLIIGDPAYGKDPDYRFPPLPGALAEAQTVQRLLGGTLLSGADASVRRVVASLRRPPEPHDLLYFATHGIASAHDPVDGSFIALAGGRLNARKIQNMRFKGPAIVILSACQTGLGRAMPGGVIGLARAFYKAGAVQVVMSHWSVDDAATQFLMTRLAKRLGHMPTAAALRQAMQETRTEFPDPFYWAAFSTFGAPNGFPG